MKNVLEHIIKSLVINKDNVTITEEKKDKLVYFHINVDKEDIGKVIGHEGKIAKSIRSIMGAIATVENVKVIIDIK